MTPNTESMSLKELGEAYSNAIWNRKDLGAIDLYVHPDVVIHSLLGVFEGSQAMHNIIKAWLKAFPDLEVHHDHCVAEGDTVAIHWGARGTHQGEFKGRLPSGKSVSYNGVSLYRIENGQIVEYWAYVDMQRLLDQIA